MQKNLSNSSYTQLENSIRQEIQNSERDIKQRLVQMYWNIGEMISNNLLENKGRTNYGDHLFDRLAESLNKNKHAVDIFYSSSQANPHKVALEGRFLNQELLN